MKKILLVLLVCLVRASCAPAPVAAPVQVSESTRTARPEPAAPAINSRIVFVSDRDGNDEIYTMEADGSDAQRLTNNQALDGGPDWSSDGEQILFHTARDGNIEIYVMNQDGGNPVNLTNSQFDDTYPAWSPDMQKIAFVSKRDGNSEIYVMDANGSAQTRLTDNPDMDSIPRWSPDGSKIAFTSIRGGNMDVYVMDADGSNQIRLTSDAGDDASAAWSPDGRQIAFDSGRDGQWELYLMDSDGSNQTRLTYTMGYYGFPDWSPDGAKLVFLRESEQNYDIYLIDVNRLTFMPLTNQGANEYDPRWSPGSAELAELALKAFEATIYPLTHPTNQPPILPTVVMQTEMPLPPLFVRIVSQAEIFQTAEAVDLWLEFAFPPGETLAQKVIEDYLSAGVLDVILPGGEKKSFPQVPSPASIAFGDTNAVYENYGTEPSGPMVRIPLGELMGSFTKGQYKLSWQSGDQQSNMVTMEWDGTQMYFQE